MLAHARVGLVGCGTVGSAFAELLEDRRESVEATTGIRLELGGIAVRDLSKPRSARIPAHLLSDDAEALVRSDRIDVVVELIGGVTAAKDIVLAALKAGKPVITGNKELVAAHGPEIFAAAAESKVDFLFEAAAVAAVPIVRPLRESLLAEDIRSVVGIVNGTTNFMLTRMTEGHLTYDEALAEAQQLGYAEPDPTADVEGSDAASKLAILSSLAFQRAVHVSDVDREGIVGLTPDDFDTARAFGHRIKYLAVAEGFPGEGPEAEPEIGLQVFPALVPENHPLANVNGSFNAVEVIGADAGELLFYGRGAGPRPTASAILGDVVDAVDHVRRGTFRPVPNGRPAKVRPTAELEHAFYLKLEIVDAPGVLSVVSGVLGRHGVSIRSLEQHGHDDQARVVFVTHRTSERALHAALAELRDAPQVRDIGRVMRVFGA